MTEQETEVMVKEEVFKKYKDLTEEEKCIYDSGYFDGDHSFGVAYWSGFCAGIAVCTIIFMIFLRTTN